MQGHTDTHKSLFTEMACLFVSFQMNCCGMQIQRTWRSWWSEIRSGQYAICLTLKPAEIPTKHFRAVTLHINPKMLNSAKDFFDFLTTDKRPKSNLGLKFGKERCLAQSHEHTNSQPFQSNNTHRSGFAGEGEGDRVQSRAQRIHHERHWLFRSAGWFTIQSAITISVVQRQDPYSFFRFKIRIEIHSKGSSILRGFCSLLPCDFPRSYFQLYNFGETVSICFWTEDWRPDSFYDKIAVNKERGFHTLCLLGTRVSHAKLSSRHAVDLDNFMQGKTSETLSAEFAPAEAILSRVFASNEIVI